MVDLRVPVNKGGAGEQRSERERGKTAVGDDVATKIGREETTAERAKIEVVCRGRAINLSFSFFPGNKIRIERPHGPSEERMHSTGRPHLST